MSGLREVWVTGIGAAGPWGLDATAIPERGLLGEKPRGVDLDHLLEGLAAKHLRHADRAGMYAAGAARLALASAGLAPPQTGVGILLGSDYGAYPANLAHQRRLDAEGAKFVSPAEFTITLPNMAAAFASIALGLRGPAATFADGGTAGGSAIGAAFDMIRLGDAHALLAGVVEPSDTDCDHVLNHFGGGRIPERPEHAAMWLLEAAEHATTAGRTPIARLLEYTTGRGDAAPPSNSTDLWHLSGIVARGGAARRTDSWWGPSCAPQVRSLTWESC